MSLEERILLFADAADGITYRLSATPERIRPDAVPGLKLWLRADAGTFQDPGGTVAASAPGAPIGRWADQSGNGNHAIQANAAAKPVLQAATLNGLPTIQFDGVNDLLTLTTRITTARTIIVVMKWTNTTTEYLPLLGDTQTWDLHGGGTGCGNTAAHLLGLHCAHSRVTGGSGFVNGIPTAPATILRPTTFQVVSLVTTDVIAFSNIAQDRGIARLFAGSYAEIAVYDTPLNLVERQGVEKYLMTRYRLS